MKSSFVVLCLAIAFTSVNAQQIACSSSQSFTVNSTSGTVGCASHSNGVTLNWLFSKLTRAFTITFNDYSDARLYVYVDGSLFQSYSPFSGSLPLYIPADQEIKLTYTSGGYSVSGYGPKISFAQVAPPTPIVSTQTYNLNKQQEGGFVYFSLPYTSFGQLLYVEVDVYSYSGLQEPSVFIANSYLPTLEKYDFTNTTIKVGDKEQFTFFKASPASGSYIFGVFLYGSAARLSITATWQYAIPALSSGVKVSDKASGVKYYQVNLPINVKQLKFQISRQVPGGYPIAYINEGTVPSASNYKWIADTNTQSYISITINDPNPSGASGPNPGTYIIAISGDNAGYIMQCDW